MSPLPEIPSPLTLKIMYVSFLSTPRLLYNVHLLAVANYLPPSDTTIRPEKRGENRAELRFGTLHFKCVSAVAGPNRDKVVKLTLDKVTLLKLSNISSNQKQFHYKQAGFFLVALALSVGLNIKMGNKCTLKCSLTEGVIFASPSFLRFSHFMPSVKLLSHPFLNRGN